ncbi:MAG TPA: glycosyltransferase [Patescibacteria group bacterium]|jgi:glycosyltransferase involved in cell wall biosynthesis|nr:glycosyltransferase [Patescibacteria group bacterium]
MRIVIASDLHWPTINGVATFCRNIAYGLAERGHEVIVIAPSQTGKSYREHDRNHWIYRTTSVQLPIFQNLRISLHPNAQVLRIMERFNPDVVHIQTPLFIGRAALAAAKKLDTTIVATSHGLPANLVDNLKLLVPFARPIDYILKEYGSRFYGNADYITLPTQAAIDMLDNGDVKAPVTAVSNGIDLRRFKPGKATEAFSRNLGVPADRPIVLYVGRLDSEKHLFVLVKAMVHVLEHTKAHLLIVGHGNDSENLKTLVEKLGIAQHVTFTGKVSDEDLPLFYHLGSVFVMPSPAELQSLTTLEAMASGLPIVAVRDGVLSELCQDGRNGKTYLLDDDKDMAANILDIINDDATRSAMSKESLEIAKTHDLINVLTKFEALYQDAIKLHQEKSR